MTINNNNNTAKRKYKARRLYDPKVYKNCYNYTNDLMKDEVTVILEDVEFAWKKKDMDLVVKLWRYNKSIKYIIERIDRDGDEVFLLLLHLARNGLIKKRENFIWGDGEKFGI